MQDIINEAKSNMEKEFHRIAMEVAPLWVYVCFGIGLGMCPMLPGIGLFFTLAALVGGIMHHRRKIWVWSIIIALLSLTNSILGVYYVNTHSWPWSAKVEVIVDELPAEVPQEDTTSEVTDAVHQ